MEMQRGPSATCSTFPTLDGLMEMQRGPSATRSTFPTLQIQQVAREEAREVRAHANYNTATKQFAIKETSETAFAKLNLSFQLVLRLEVFSRAG